MASSKYLTAPVPSSKLPGGIPYIVGNEAAERFSFYGMRTILVVFMTTHLLNAAGQPAAMTGDQAKFTYHLFVMSAYFFPIIGAMISDAFLGKYPTILILSLVYCAGHLALALDETRLGLFLGLALIAVGSGGIKPCVSAHVGDQFGRRNQHLLSKIFGWFYFSINLGAFASTLLTPELLAHPDFGPRWAFGVPGVLMAVATLVFWLGRHKFVHIPPVGWRAVVSSFRSTDGRRALRNLVGIYLFVAVFWSLYDQTGSAWVLQARRMDRRWLGIDWLPSQVGAVNPILILVYIPIFSYLVYPLVDRLFRLTPLRKISIGFFVTVIAFAVSAGIDTEITGGQIIEVTSEANADRSPVDHLLDGRVDGTGWISAETTDMPQTIIIRLRERRAWTISAVRINPYSREDEETWGREAEIAVGDSPVGPWTNVGRLTIEPRNGFQSVEFTSPVSAEYVRLRVRSTGEGRAVSLGEVEVLADGPRPANANPHAAAVWPNVAALGYQPNIVWQLLAYLLLTAAEIMVSITCLEFSYTQAPRQMKSFIMSLFLLSVAGGNAFTSLVNYFIQNDNQTSKLEGPAYYWFFTALMLAAAVGFIAVAQTYRGKTYIQQESPE